MFEDGTHSGSNTGRLPALVSQFCACTVSSLVMENKQHSFSGSTVNEDLTILTVEDMRGSTEKNRTPGWGSFMVLGCNNGQISQIIGCRNRDDHLLVLLEMLS